MVFFMGYLGTPKLIYSIVFWTVNTTDQRAIFGNLGFPSEGMAAFARSICRSQEVYPDIDGSPVESWL